MSMTHSINARVVVLPVAIALLLLPVRANAAEVNKYLPDDTGAVVTINVRAALDSPLVKKYAMDHIKQALKDNEEAQKVLNSLGLDPLKDIDQAVIAGSDIGESKALVIVTGRFDPDKIKAKAVETAKNQPDALKLHAAGGYSLYEVKMPDQPQPVFAAVADKNTIVASPSRDFVIDALDKGTGKKKGQLKSKEVTSLLERIDGKQSLWIAVGGSTLEKSIPPVTDESVKELLKKVSAISGGVTTTEDVKAQFVVSAKDAQGAKELDQLINDGVNQGLGLLALLVSNQKELAPLLDVVKSIKIATKDNAVTITGTVPGDLIEKAMKANP
jgi:hypothetical protein